MKNTLDVLAVVAVLAVLFTFVGCSNSVQGKAVSPMLKGSYAPESLLFQHGDISTRDDIVNCKMQCYQDAGCEPEDVRGRISPYCPSRLSTQDASECIRNSCHEFQ